MRNRCSPGARPSRLRARCSSPDPARGDLPQPLLMPWYRRPESNRHGPFGPRDFKSRASTHSATPASREMVAGSSGAGFADGELQKRITGVPTSVDVSLEATGGFEPPNKGFADLSLNHLGTSPRAADSTRYPEVREGAPPVDPLTRSRSPG